MGEILSPLPFYDMAAPFGFTAALKLIYQIFGLNEYLLRLPALLSFLGIFYIAKGFFNLSNLERSVFSLFLLSSNVVLTYFFMTKHYITDLFFILLLLSENIKAVDFPEAAFWRRLCVGLIVIPFVTQSLVIFTALAAGYAIFELRNLPRGTARHSLPIRKWANFLIPIIIPALIALVVYYFVLRPGVAAQFKSDRYGYDGGFSSGLDLYFILNQLRLIAESHLQTSTYFSSFNLGAIFLLAAIGYCERLVRDFLTSSNRRCRVIRSELLKGHCPTAGGITVDTATQIDNRCFDVGGVGDLQNRKVRIRRDGVDTIWRAGGIGDNPISIGD